ncbi:hypothetical protein GGG16DRAFT_90813 [Schizophyllum commune]
MRGEICVSFGFLLSVASLCLLIVTHCGQINTDKVPNKVSMAQLNTSGYADTLEVALLDPVEGLYASNASAPLGEQQGLRELYRWGMYSYGGFININETTHNGTISNKTAGYQYRPYDALLSDMPEHYRVITDAIITDMAFTDSSYLGSMTKAAYWMLLLATITTFLAAVTGVIKRSYLFFFSTAMSIISALLLLIGCTVYTVAVKKSQIINDFTIQSQSTGEDTPLGLVVSVGEGIYLIWAAFVLTFISVIPYMLSCCTYRG